MTLRITLTVPRVEKDALILRSVYFTEMLQMYSGFHLIAMPANKNSKDQTNAANCFPSVPTVFQMP